MEINLLNVNLCILLRTFRDVQFAVILCMDVRVTKQIHKKMLGCKGNFYFLRLSVSFSLTLLCLKRRLFSSLFLLLQTCITFYFLCEQKDFNFSLFLGFKIQIKCKSTESPDQLI